MTAAQWLWPSPRREETWVLVPTSRTVYVFLSSFSFRFECRGLLTEIFGGGCPPCQDFHWQTKSEESVSVSIRFTFQALRYYNHSILSVTNKSCLYHSTHAVSPTGSSVIASCAAGCEPISHAAQSFLK